MSGIFRRFFEELVLEGQRLGRHVAHDVRSLAFPAEAAPALKSVMHKRRAPIFDQGDLGSCTGNACAGMLSTEPFALNLTEADAVALYARATQLDNIRGTYPPDDTGSSTLGVLKAAKSRGMIKSYRHAFGLDHALRSLVLRPGIVGITWLDGCDNPDENGIVSYAGAVRGGHEIEMVGLDVEQSLVWFANSWGADWGRGGFFAMTFDDFGTALDDDGDVGFATP